MSHQLTLAVSDENSLAIMVSAPLSDVDFSFSKQTLSRPLHTQEPVCSNTVSSHPCQFAQNILALWKDGLSER